VSSQDEHGQAPNHYLAYSRVVDRSIDELIGLCKGIMADGVVMQEEAEFLLEWLNTNRYAADQWPANVIYPRLQQFMEDGILDAEEERELFLLLSDMGGRTKTMPDAQSPATRLPLDTPAPAVKFDGKNFVITGRFASGNRKVVTSEIVARGGKVAASVTKRTNYLVIGDIGSRDWIHSTHGRKIEKAIELCNDNRPIAIISEEHWISFLK